MPLPLLQRGRPATPGHLTHASRFRLPGFTPLHPFEAAHSPRSRRCDAAAHAAGSRARARPWQACPVPLPAHCGQRARRTRRCRLRCARCSAIRWRAMLESKRIASVSRMPRSSSPWSPSSEPDEKIPESERFSSASCVCFALLQAAQAAGFGAQWLTGWPAYDHDVLRLLGLARRREDRRLHPRRHAASSKRPNATARCGRAAERLVAGMSAPTPQIVGHAPRPCTWSMRACTCSARGIRCRTSSAMPTAGRRTPCTALRASCSNCSNASVRSHIAIAFDEALDSCFRNALYPAYKANREPAPEELRRQFGQCKALCAARSGWWCSRTANTKPTT